MEQNQQKNVYGYIYKITNLINNKVYIGQTTKSIETRFKDHKVRSSSKSSRYNTHLYNSMYLYGKQNFKVEELCRCFYKEELDFMENFFIMNIYDSMNPDIGYNKRGGGGNGKLSEEIKLKISKANKGKVRTKEHAMKIANTRKVNGTYTITEETRKKQSEAKKGKNLNLSEEALKKMSKKMREFNKNRTKENIQKATEKMMETKKRNGSFAHSEETKKKISKSNKGKKMSKEALKKLSISQKNAWSRKTEDEKKLAIKKYRETISKKTPEELQAIINKTQSTIKANGGVKHSKESRVKRVITRKSNGSDWHSEETKRKISETKRGKKLKKEQIDKMIATKKAKGILNYKHTKETREKMSESNKLRWKKIKEQQKLEKSNSSI